MALLAVCLCAIGVILFKPIPHATIISLWDGTASHPFLKDDIKPHGETAQGPVNRITLTFDDQVLWNSEPISAEQLRTLLWEAQTLDPQPAIELEPAANSSYDLAARVINLMNSTGTAYRIAGMEKHCTFNRGGPSVPWSGGSTSLSLTTTISIDPEMAIAPHFVPDIPTCEPKVAIQQYPLPLAH